MVTSEKIKILWLIPKWTLPVNDGARVATDSLVRNSIREDLEIDVLCLCNQNELTNIDELKNHWKVRDIQVHRRNIPELLWPKRFYYLKQLLKRPLTPLTFSSFAEKELVRNVHRIISDKEYDYLFLDGLHLAVPILSKKQLAHKLIYRAHNIESDLWIKAAKEKKNIILKLMLYYQYYLIRTFEKKLYDLAHGIAPISQEDLDEITNYKKRNVELVPLGLNFSYPLDPPLESMTKFLFIGRLDWPPNKDGLEWVLQEVWPEVIRKRPEAILKIVGSGNRDWLDKYSSLKGIQTVGFIENIKDAYRDCHFTIVPVFYGSGTRIKVLESFAMGRKLISTKMGVQGANLTREDYFQAETKEEWITLLSKVSWNKEIQRSLNQSIDKVSHQFGEESVGSKFVKWLRELE
jgi:hypothetical protein